MPKPDDIVQARGKTIAQLRAQLVPTKRDALIAINDGSEIYSDPLVMKYREKDGQIESQSETICDVETGALISTKTIAWTYYDSEKGVPVDTIAIVETDSKGKETARKVIKHYPDNRQPHEVK